MIAILTAGDYVETRDQAALGLSSLGGVVSVVAAVAQIADFVATGKVDVTLIAIVLVAAAFPIAAALRLLRAKSAGSRFGWNIFVAVTTVSMVVAATATAAVAVVGILDLTSSDPDDRTNGGQGPHVTIESPTENQEVVGNEGVLISGTARDLQDRHLRVVDHADNGLYYLLGDGPVPVNLGKWSFFNRQIGSSDGSDAGNVFTMIVVIADIECEKALDATAPNNEGDRAVRKLPPSCVEGASVRVVKIVRKPPAPSISGVAHVEFTSPLENATIKAGQDVTVAGTLTGIGNDTLWVVTKPDAGGGAYYLTDNSPVAAQDGLWRFSDPQVGDNTDRGKGIRYLAVQADKGCSDSLSNADTTVDSLPAGCVIRAERAVSVK